MIQLQSVQLTRVGEGRFEWRRTPKSGRVIGFGTNLGRSMLLRSVEFLGEEQLAAQCPLSVFNDGIDAGLIPTIGRVSIITLTFVDTCVDKCFSIEDCR